MSLFGRIFKFVQSEAHAFMRKFEDPVKLMEQGIRDLKKDFDDSMHAVAQIKAIAIGAKKELAAKKQIAEDYERKAIVLLQKAQRNELDQAEAERLAGEALKKKQAALIEIQHLTVSIQNYDANLEKMEQKVLDLKNQIKTTEEEYKTLKARAAVAKTTKKINKQLSTISSDSTMAMIEDMKSRIQEEENLAEAYGEVGTLNRTVDDEINKAIGTNDVSIQNAIEEMKRNLLANPDTPKAESQIEELKKELDN